MKSRIFAVTAVCLVAQSLLAAESKYAKPELLLEPAELAKPEVAAKFVVLDTRPLADYEKEHIPGARRVDHDAWKSSFGSAKCLEWTERIGQLGITADTDVVIYDNASSKDAARIWWILRYWGQDHVRLLNGGWVGWKSAKLPTTADIPAPVKVVEFRATPRTELSAGKSGILEVLKRNRPTSQILDARSEGEFSGTQALGNKRAGCMPGAKHLEWSDLIDKKTQRFKPADELEKLFAAAQIDLNRPTITHCQSGGRSSVMAFGLELMGAKEVRNYYRGWSEWGNTDDTPIVRPEPQPAN